MKLQRVLLKVICLAVLFSVGSVLVGAQDLEPPIVDILGRPDSRSAPPDVSAYVSVVDRPSGRVIEGLQDANFSAQISEEEIQPTVALDTTGLAVVMVIDRGGIARRNDPRIGSAVDLASALLNMLNVDGTTTADLVALIGIRGQDQGGLTPAVNFTDFDPVAISNQFDALRTEVVDETTPLYDGIDRAISWIAGNPDPAIQDKLTLRRKIIFVFSDGIDRGFSDESHEALIVDQAQQNDILIYAIQMTANGRTAESDSLNAMATQSNGTFFVDSPDTHDQVISHFQDIVTQRQAYRVTFPLTRPLGDYQLQIRVLNAPGGAGSDMSVVSSNLQKPVITLNAPSNPTFVVPYSEDDGGFVTTMVPLTVLLSNRDGAPRNPDEVSYFANEQRIGVSGDVPDYAFTWDVTNLAAPSTDRITRTYTLVARATDPYLDEELQSQLVDVQVAWEPQPEAAPQTVSEAVTASVAETWWVLPIFGVLGLGLIVVIVLLVRTRGQVARKVVQNTSTAIKGVTQRLGSGGAMPAVSGKLVVVQGPRMGNEFSLATPAARVGRDAEFSDFALNDRFVSNPHFTILEEGGQFYIRDEGSTNRTRVNGVVIPPNQRLPLSPDAIIEAGQTRMQLKRLGGDTRRVGASETVYAPQTANAPGTAGAPQTAGGRPTVAAGREPGSPGISPTRIVSPRQEEPRGDTAPDGHLRGRGRCCDPATGLRG